MADNDQATGGELWKLSSISMGDTATQYVWSAATPHVEMGGSFKRNHAGINPRLYFRYVKSKLKMVELAAFKSRMKQLEKLSEKYAKLGQEALSDECVRQYYVLARESAMWACGFKVFVTNDDLEKFRYKCSVPLKITPLKNFARVIPDKAASKIKKAIDRQLFDELVVVHLDNRDKPSTLETKKEKIEREKDPICFGRVMDSEKYYFVCDWIDEFDDLKLEEIIKMLTLDKKKMQLGRKMQLPNLPMGKKGAK